MPSRGRLVAESTEYVGRGAGQPRGTDDAGSGQDFWQAQFRLSLCASINALRTPRIVALVRHALGAVAYIPRTEKQQLCAKRFRSVGDGDHAIPIHGEGESGILFAAIHVRVGGSKNDPVGTVFLDNVANPGSVADVQISRAGAHQLSACPLAHERSAEQPGGANDHYFHK